MRSEPFAIHALSAPGGGEIGLSPMPGRAGDLAGDLEVIRDWGPTLALSLVGDAELVGRGVGDLAERLEAQGTACIRWPVVDFGVPGANAGSWPAVSARAHVALDAGGRLLVHCQWGCGRSGMVALRLLIERGEPPGPALARLRAVRPCAVETAAQQAWAFAGRPRRA